MNRRSALKKTALISGGVVSLSALSAILQKCTIDKGTSYEPKFLSITQFRTLSDITETIIPVTETPGAKDVGVDRFIDMAVTELFKTEEKDNFLSGIKMFEEECQKDYARPFYKCETTQQQEFLKKIQTRSLKNMEESPGNKEPFFITVKRLTLWGYFTSERGIKENLQYLPIPGKYDGCISISKEDKSLVGNHV